MLIKIASVTSALHGKQKIQDIEMAPKKTATLNLRIDPAIKEALREAASQEQRSIANMVEVLIRKHCTEAGIPVHEQGSLFEEKDDSRE